MLIKYNTLLNIEQLISNCFVVWAHTLAQMFHKVLEGSPKSDVPSICLSLNVYSIIQYVTKRESLEINYKKYTYVCSRTFLLFFFSNESSQDLSY